MALLVGVLSGSDVTLQIGNNKLKSLMMARAIYETLHPKYRSTVLQGSNRGTVAFSSLCQ